MSLCTLERVTVAMAGRIVLDLSGDQLALRAALNGGVGLDGSMSFVVDLPGAGVVVRTDVRPRPLTLRERIRAWLGRS